MIPFSPPRIDQKVIDEVTAVLRSGWITTGPRTKQFEREITSYCGCRTTVAVNSWTMGMQVLLDWWGLKEGDEIILPAYTHCASANVIVHSGATPVMVDVNPSDFNISVEKVEAAITPRTKAVIAVDIAGFPADYAELRELVTSEPVRSRFVPESDCQRALKRILLISDAAHSFGAEYQGKRAATAADITSYSFHAVKNLTTAEGGALCFNLPGDFDHDAIYALMNTRILHGQSKDALAKMQKNSWRYDVAEPGFKCNMTDLQAAIGLVELRRYDENLRRREEIFRQYDRAFAGESWAMTPVHETDIKKSSNHVYQLRVRGASEAERDAIIREIFEQGVSVNVHFQPLPLLTAYKKRGYRMEDYPEAYRKYSNEISLPVFFDLTDGQVQTVIAAVRSAVSSVLGG